MDMPMGKRFRVASFLAGLLLALASRAAAADDEIFVTNRSGNSVTVYARTASGNVTPLRTLAGPSTALSTPEGLAVDTVNDELFVANNGNNSITVYPRTATGNVAPLRTISGASTTLDTPFGLAVDTVHNEVVVANYFTPSITVYARTANGNVAPLRTVTGFITLSGPFGLAVDTVNDELVVANNSVSSVSVFARTATGMATPLRAISGPATGLAAPYGVAVDTANNELLVVSNNTSAVTVYSRTANGNVAPLRTISGVSTGLTPNGLAVDPVNNELVVANTNRSLTIHARTASGDIAPLRTVSGLATGLDGPAFVAVTLGGVPAGAQFHTLTPCRAVDTRGAAGPYGGPALAHLGTRTFLLFGRCGIPGSAKAVAVNLTVTQSTNGPGFLTLYPAGAALPLASSINYKAGQTRANSAVMPLGATGGLNAYCQQGSGTVHFILDVYGYFE